MGFADDQCLDHEGRVMNDLIIPSKSSRSEGLLVRFSEGGDPQVIAQLRAAVAGDGAVCRALDVYDSATEALAEGVYGPEALEQAVGQLMSSYRSLRNALDDVYMRTLGGEVNRLRNELQLRRSKKVTVKRNKDGSSTATIKEED